MHVVTSHVLPLEQAVEHPLPRGEQEKQVDAVESRPLSPDGATDTEVKSCIGICGWFSRPDIIPRGECALQEATVTPAQPGAEHPLLLMVQGCCRPSEPPVPHTHRAGQGGTRGAGAGWFLSQSPHVCP